MRKTLTNAGVRGLEPRTKAYAYPDPERRGHYVRVRPSGAKSYVAVARSPAGKQVWTSIGRVDLLTIEQAREQARDAIKLTLAGMSPDLARSAAGSLEMRIAAKAAAFIANGIEPACYLYRHYNPRGDLIYCGVTLSPLRRNEQHATDAMWRRTILKILIEPFTSREEALEAEQRAIELEFPKFNKTHNQRRHPWEELRRIETRKPKSEGKPHA